MQRVIYLETSRVSSTYLNGREHAPVSTKGPLRLLALTRQLPVGPKQRPVLLIVLLSLVMVACGSTSGGLSSSHAGLKALGSRGDGSLAASTRIPPLRYLAGDYDGDDYDSRRNDSDNDDSKQPRDGDNDLDSAANSGYDSDDRSVLALGHPANPAVKHAVASLVKGYFAAAASEDGQAACSMLVSSISKSVPQDLGQSPGPPYLHGKTCAVVMRKVFKQDHRQLALYPATIQVAAVRVSRSVGVAVLRFKTLPRRQVRIVRDEDGTWKIEAYLDGELP